MPTLQTAQPPALVDLEEQIQNRKAVVIALDPFVGELRIALKMKSAPFQGLCHYGSGHVVEIQNFQEIPPETYLLTYFDGTTYTALFCLSHADMITHLSAGLNLCVKSGSSRQANKVRPALVAIRSECLYTLQDKLAHHVLRETGSIGKRREEKAALPNAFETLGWSSKSAFGTDVTHDGILKAVRSLKAAGITPGYVLIDEGWQSLEKSHKRMHPLQGFGADKERFPKGLKGLIEELHAENVFEIGVWHGIMGSRCGVHERLAKYYDLPPDAKGRYFPGYDLGKTFQFFYDYYAYLKDQGITFVEVGDLESVPGYVREGMDITRIYKNLETATQGAFSLHFNSVQIRSESLRPENLLYWTSASVATSSAPAINLRAHLQSSMWLSAFMEPLLAGWSSTDEKARIYAHFHALSGNLNIIHDAPDTHARELLKQVALPSGRLFKTDAPLQLNAASCFSPEVTLHKTFTYKGETGLLGLFNFTSAPQKTTISPADIPQLKGEVFALYSNVFGFLGVLKKNESTAIEVAESDIITVAPVKDATALIGYPQLLVPSGPLLSMTAAEETLHIHTHVSGPLILYCEKKILEIKRNGAMAPWAHDHRTHILQIEEQSTLYERPSHYIVIFE